MFDFLIEKECNIDADCLIISASKGNLKIFTSLYEYYLKSKYVMIDINDVLIESACENGSFEIVKFLILNKYVTQCGDDTLFAIKSGNLELVRWLENIKHTNDFGDTFVREALYYGHFHILDWLYENNYCTDIPTNIIMSITEGVGDLVPKLQWLLNMNYNFTREDIDDLKALRSDEVNHFLKYNNKF